MYDCVDWLRGAHLRQRVKRLASKVEVYLGVLQAHRRVKRAPSTHVLGQIEGHSQVFPILGERDFTIGYVQQAAYHVPLPICRSVRIELSGVRLLCGTTVTEALFVSAQL